MNDSLSSAKGNCSRSRKRRSEWQLLLLVLAASLGMRIFALLRVGIICSDGLIYSDIATEILAGKWIESNRTLLFNPYSALIALLHSTTGISQEMSGMLLNAIPGGLAVLPLYFWCREAFDRRVALMTAWLYALHPILIRCSAPMMRDGLYWFCLIAAVQLGWSALNRSSMLRFLGAGFFATCAALNRTEGLALFSLFLMWGITLPRSPVEFRFVSLRRALGTVSAIAVFPAVLIGLNLAILPPSEPFSGFERIGFLSPTTSRWIETARSQYFPIQALISPAPLAAVGKLQTSEPPLSVPTVSVPPAEVKIATNESVPTPIPSVVIPVSVEEIVPELPVIPESSISEPLRTMPQLLDRIRIWNDAGDNIDPEGYYLRSFLMLADEHRNVLYFSMFSREILHGYRLPVLICFFCGLYFSRRYWKFSRDLPLLVFALFLFGAVYLHLMKTNIIESRYLLSTLLFILPWSGRGLRCLLILGRYYARQYPASYIDLGAWLAPRRLIPLTMLISGSVVFWSLRLTKDEIFQKEVGLMISREPHVADSMAGFGTFARAGYYAKLPYTKLPPNSDRAWNWLASDPPAFVLLRAKSPEGGHLVKLLNESPAFERAFADNPKFSRYLIYRLRETPKEKIAAAAE